MRTDMILRDQWASYRAKVIPADAPAVQVRECLRAYVAGAVVALGVLDAIAAPTVDEDHGVVLLEQLHVELAALVAEMGES